MKKLILSVIIFSSAILLSSCCGSGCGNTMDYATSYSSSGCCGASSSCCGSGGW